MRILWTAINTTALEPVVANVIELSMQMQVDGQMGDRLDWKVEPIYLPDDSNVKDRPAQVFLDAYRKWIKTSSPTYALTVFDGGSRDRAFFYNPDSLQHLKTYPADLVPRGDRLPAKKALHQLIKFLDGKKCVIAAHNVGFVSDCLKAWAKRCDAEAYKELSELIMFKSGIDTLPFFKVVAAFNPALSSKGFGLKGLVSTVHGISMDCDAKSKLDSLLRTCEKVLVQDFLPDEVLYDRAVPSNQVSTKNF